MLSDRPEDGQRKERQRQGDELRLQEAGLSERARAHPFPLCGLRCLLRLGDPSVYWRWSMREATKKHRPPTPQNSALNRFLPTITE